MRTLFPFRSTSVIASLLERDIMLKSDWYSNCRFLEQVTEGLVVVEEVLIGKPVLTLSFAVMSTPP